MKAGWKTVKLEEVCAIEFGERVVRKNDAGTLYPVYGGGGATFNIDRHNRESCVVVSRFGMSERCVRFVEGKFFLNDSGLTVTSTSPEASQRYIDLLLHANAPEIYSLGGGTAQKNLDTKSFRILEIPLPPLAEQKRIVALLDEAFAGIDEAKAKAEANLANARKLTENYFQSVIEQQGRDWTQKQLLELCDIKHGYAFEGEFFSTKGDYVLLTPGNFYERGGYRDRGEKQKYYTGEIPREYVLSKGDLLVAMTEQAAGLLGSPIIVPESDKFLHNQRLGLVTKKPGAAWTNRFFFHIFNSMPVRKSIHDSASGVKVRHTSPKKIGDVVVMVPSSTSEQDKIVENMESLDEYMKSLSSLYQRKQITLVQLKQSLLAQAFAGELTA
jgi:type I restriction enzyme S subunit